MTSIVSYIYSLEFDGGINPKVSETLCFLRSVEQLRPRCYTHVVRKRSHRWLAVFLMLGIFLVCLLPTTGLSPTALRAARSAAKIFLALMCAATIWSGLFATLILAMIFSSKRALSPRAGELSLSCVSRC